MRRTGGRCPRRSEIGELGLQAFHIEAQGGTARKRQQYHAAGRVFLDKLDREQVQDRPAVSGPDAATFDGIHPIKSERRPAALIARPRLRPLPIEAIERHHQPLVLWLPDNIGNFDG